MPEQTFMFQQATSGGEDAGSWAVPDASTLHLWMIDLHQTDAIADRLQGTLDARESARAQRLRHESDRRRFVVAHGALRAVLGAYLGCEPESVVLSADAFGKPCVASPAAGTSISFSQSRSGDLGLLALSDGRDVGVDLEQRRPVREWADIARQFFTEGEYEMLRALPPERREAAFLKCWTLKEAYVKAVGTGLSLALDSFDVGPCLLRAAAALPMPYADGGPVCWYAYDIRMTGSYIGSAVTFGPTSSLLLRPLDLAQLLAVHCTPQLYLVNARASKQEARESSGAS